jgi:membrane protease YdiL (CAAX protease family)
VPVGQESAVDLREPLLAYAAVIALAAGLYWAARAVTLVDQLMQGAIAFAFLFGPQLAARISGRAYDPLAAGLSLRPSKPGLRTLAGALLITWPLFIGGFLLYYGALCPGHIVPAAWTRALAPMCRHWSGLAGWQLRLPDGFVMLALSQILVVAIPEEAFFRGYLMYRLEQRWPSRRRVWGTAVGWPLVVSSALFALGHFLVDLQPLRLAVFFPALAFGFMRSRSGSVAPGALFHALCNLLSAVLHESFFG